MKKQAGSSEPYFYIALVLKGSEEQYLDLLRYVNDKSGAKIIYQCKSLTYLHVVRDDGVKFEAAPAEFLAAPEQSEVDAP
jgi:hypothetical protein